MASFPCNTAAHSLPPSTSTTVNKMTIMLRNPSRSPIKISNPRLTLNTTKSPLVHLVNHPIKYQQISVTMKPVMSSLVGVQAGNFPLPDEPPAPMERKPEEKIGIFKLVTSRMVTNIGWALCSVVLLTGFFKVYPNFSLLTIMKILNEGAKEVEAPPSIVWLYLMSWRFFKKHELKVLKVWSYLQSWNFFKKSELAVVKDVGRLEGIFKQAIEFLAMGVLFVVVLFIGLVLKYLYSQAFRRRV